MSWIAVEKKKAGVLPAVADALRRSRSGVGLIAVFAAAVILSPRAADGSNIFLDAGNLTDVMRQMAVIGIMALAMTFVILTAGIDLSVGSILALSTSVVGLIVTRPQGGMAPWAHIVLAIAAAALASLAVGALNGAVIAALRIQPFIVTLASMIGIRGLAKWLTGNANIDIGFGADQAAAFARVFSEKAVVIGSFAALAGVFWMVLGRTVFGRYVKAIGDNEKAARYSGLPIRSITIRGY